jgi:hypothetical protein
VVELEQDHSEEEQAEQVVIELLVMDQRLYKDQN